MNGAAQIPQNTKLLLDYYSSDRVDRLDRLSALWQLIRTPAARYAEAHTYLEQGNSEAAKTMIEDHPEEDVFKVKQESERWRMLALIEYLQGVKTNGRSVAHLTIDEQEALEAIIADQRDRPATWAQNILCFHYGKCRAPLTGDAKVAPKSRQPMKKADAEHAEATLRVYPNPASKYATVEVDLAADPENALVELKDVAGKVLQQLRVSSSVAQVVLDCGQVASGTYTVQLVNHGVVLLTEKLIIKQ